MFRLSFQLLRIHRIEINGLIRILLKFSGQLVKKKNHKLLYSCHVPEYREKLPFPSSACSSVAQSSLRVFLKICLIYLDILLSPRCLNCLEEPAHLIKNPHK